MANGLFIQLPSEFSDTTIPKLYRDKVITAGTKYVFDSVDTYSWVKQTAPLTTDKWTNLLDGGATASFGPGITFDKKAFKLNTGTGDVITLPSSGIAAANADGFAMVFWILPDAPTGACGIMGAADDFYTTCQYAFTWNASNQIIGWVSGIQQNVENSPVATSPLQLGVSYKKRVSDGKYDITLWKNGVAIYTTVSPETTIRRPTTQTNPKIGETCVFGSAAWAGHILRTWFDDCSITPAGTLITLDYSENLARLTAAAA